MSGFFTPRVFLYTCPERKPNGYASFTPGLSNYMPAEPEESSRTRNIPPHLPPAVRHTARITASLVVINPVFTNAYRRVFFLLAFVARGLHTTNPALRRTAYGYQLLKYRDIVCRSGWPVIPLAGGPRLYSIRTDADA